MGLRSWILWKGEELLMKFFSKFLFVPSSAGTLIITRDGRIVGINTGDYYTLVGGIVEAGESFEAGAIREAKEEAGVDIKIIKRVEENVRPNFGVEVIFLAVIESGTLEGSKEGEPEFLTPEEALKAKWRHNRDIEALIEKALRDYEQHVEEEKEEDPEPEILGVEDPY